MTSDWIPGDSHANGLVFGREDIEPWLRKRLERTKEKKSSKGSLVWNKTLGQRKGRV